MYEEDVATGERMLLKRTPVLGGSTSRATARPATWATSADGTRVPVDVVWREGTPRDGTAPLLLYGYGAYEARCRRGSRRRACRCSTAAWVWALAHPRGGGELGRQWYLDGKLLHKRNTFTDFIACAEHLVPSGFGAPERVGDPRRQRRWAARRGRR